MCLAVPMILKHIYENEPRGVVEMGGVKHDVMLSLLSDYNIGDYLIIHAGFAIEKLNKEEAFQRLKLFKELEQIKQEESNE